MLRYTETIVGFSEVPEEIALCINISNCPIHCKGCHSPHLWSNIGKELDDEALLDLIDANDGITCIAFMGGDADADTVMDLARWVKENTKLKTCWYSGKSLEEIKVDCHALDYIKTGPYIEELGGLDCPNTNQKFFEVIHTEDNSNYLKDITYKFKNEANDKSKSIN